MGSDCLRNRVSGDKPENAVVCLLKYTVPINRKNARNPSSSWSVSDKDPG